MNLGKTILDLRKKKDVTQDELAAELGVTAAAVSKWENGYTLPDILMLCALADYFQVTTDELLGRNPKLKYAVIATDLPDLNQPLAERAKSYGFFVKHICSSLADAFEAVKADPSITHLFSSFEKPLSEEEKNEGPDGLSFIEVRSQTREQVLDCFDIYFQNMIAYDSLVQKRPIKE